MSEEIMESSGKMPSLQMSSTEEMEIERMEMEIKSDLYIMAMKGKWDTVVEIYTQNPRAHKVKITRSGDTALHMAVSDGKEEIVKKLIDQIMSPRGGDIEALKIRNKLGNTPLHLAVSMGTVAMCKWIAQVDSSLVGEKNGNGETPFFLAAFHGRKDVFLLLLRICGSDRGLLYSRRENGETILHVAIAGDYFDLAFQIIHLYPGLVNCFDHEGFSPLHRLAGNPSNFRSCSHFGLYDKIIYHCLVVDELQMDPKVLKELIDHQMHVREELQGIDEPLMEMINQRSDAESNNESSSRFQSFWKYVDRHGSEVTKFRAPRSEPIPPNYVTCFEFLKVSLKAVQVVLGTGYTEIRKIEDKKKKYTWSVQIMNELLKHTSMNEYDNTGMDPRSKQPEGETHPYSSVGEGCIPELSEANRSNKSGSTDTGGEGGDEHHEKAKNETTILIAAKNGVTKISESIKEYFPVAIREIINT